MVNLPCVSWLSLAKASKALTAALGRTEIPNLALAAVYSWPGWKRVSVFTRSFNSLTYKDASIIRKRPQCLVQRLVHLLAIALEEPAAACRQSERTSRKEHR